MKKNILKYILFIFISFLTYYIVLPPINLTSKEFWGFLIILIVYYILLNTIFSVNNILKINKNSIKDFTKKSIIFMSIFIVIFISIILINIFNSPLLNSKKYYNRININEKGDFDKDIKEVDFNKIPLLDKDSSEKLGDRVMGTMTDLVSQYEVSNLYTQINYNDNITRVTPLEYSGLIKYFTNRKKGVVGYITVNSVSGESKLTRLKKGMKIMPSAYLSEDLNRVLRFHYPTTIFGDASFELDNEGNPYWIIPTIKYRGVGLIKEVSGIVILDPIKNTSKKYKVGNVPSWVDHVYNADLIIEQVDDWGLYKNGFWNSIFGQKNVVMTTDGYSYTVMNDDVYLYTGITSVANDESNIGFILTNMRTKETKFYNVSGAEEYSAMDSAEGQVQQMKYNATFPLLINLNNKPTYLMSLKDNAGLVKMYAFVDVNDYQKVVVTDSSKGIETASNNYLNDVIDSSKSFKEETITIKSISNAVIEGTTYYFITDISNNKYKVSIKVNNIIPFLNINDKINISYTIKKDITDIRKIK